MIDFDTPDLAREVEKLSPGQIDALPFGAIRLDAQDRVVFFSKAEGRLSGYGDRPTIGKLFFADIAPCMDAAGYSHRIRRSLMQGRLDLEFRWVGDFADAGRELHVRVQSATGGGVWIFMKRPG